MRRVGILSAIILLVVCCVVAVIFIHINGNNDSNKNSIVGSVQLTTNGNSYTPYSHWVYSCHDGIAADGLWLSSVALESDTDLGEALNSLEMIPADGDFKIEKIWEDGSDRTETLPYMIFDEKLNKVENVDNIAGLYGKNGIYYIVAEAHWGNNKEYEGYQYVFKIMADKPSK